MQVSSGYARSYWRESKRCTFRRNGSFIDVWYEDDGRQKWLGLSERELRTFLDSGDAEGEGLINFDEPADVQTALREMFVRQSLDDVREVVAREVQEKHGG